MKIPLPLAGGDFDSSNTAELQVRRTMPDLAQETALAAQQLFEVLDERRQRFVAAESCTGGLIAATLVGLPGVSAWFCGSAVVYRDDTKRDWLGVPQQDLKDPQITAVSEIVARKMAEGVLRLTTEADFSVSTTGYLGPESPTGCDGLMYVGLAWRIDGAVETQVQRHIIQSAAPKDSTDAQTRIHRQYEAATIALKAAKIFLLARPTN
jgi:nicotinamide-nucleotide amidase